MARPERGTIWAILFVFAIALVTLTPSLVPPGPALVLAALLPIVAVAAYLADRVRGRDRPRPWARVPTFIGRRSPRGMDASRVLDLIEERAAGDYAEAVSYLRVPDGPEPLVAAYREAHARPSAESWAQLRREVLRHVVQGGNGQSARSAT